jgi:hypothetical protein
VKEHPIIFSGPMVRALLEGRKSQTRRLATSPLRRVQPSDKLWVRESFHPWKGSASGKTIVYVADDEWIDWGSGERFHDKVWWLSRVTPSIHMPRWASRVTLDVTDVRVEPLQEISEADASAEGVGDPYLGSPFEEQATTISCRMQYRNLWKVLHGPLSWDANPLVVALTFTVEHTCAAKA